MNSLTRLLPLEVAEGLISAGLTNEIPGLADAYARMLFRKVHPDRTIDLPKSAQLILSGIYDNTQMALEDIKDEDGLAEAIDELQTPEYRRRRADRKDQYREVDTLKQMVDALFGLIPAQDQFQVLGVDEPTSMLLEPGGARLVLDVTSHSKARLFVSVSDDDVLPEQPENAVFVDGVWTESYLDSNDSNRQRTYVHRLQSLGVVKVVGFVSSAAVQYYYSHAAMPSYAASMLGEGQSPLRFTPNWVFPREAWFSRFMTLDRKVGSDVVVLNNKGLLATVGSVVAQASK